jgi:hypothetical protein
MITKHSRDDLTTSNELSILDGNSHEAEAETDTC